MASKNAVPVASTSSANRYGNPSATLGPSPASASSSSSTAGTNSRPTAGLNQVRSTSTSSASSSTAMNTPGLSSVAQGKRPATGPTTGNSTSSSTAHRAIPGTANRPNSTTTSTTGTPATNSAAAHVRRGALNAVLVHTCQKGNPVIAHIRNVPWEYGDIKCDYQVGLTSGILFLSYHLLHPEYIHERIKKLGHDYALRIMLIQCDAEGHEAAIRELTKTCLVNEYTMMVCWSSAEVARYIELYKQYERKPPDLIKQRTDDSYLSHLTQALTSVRGVNKTDVTTLASHYGTFAQIVQAPAESLAALPGLGDKKVKRLRDAFEGSLVVGARGRKGNAANRKSQKTN